MLRVILLSLIIGPVAAGGTGGAGLRGIADKSDDETHPNAKLQFEALSKDQNYERCSKPFAIDPTPEVLIGAHPAYQRDCNCVGSCNDSSPVCQEDAACCNPGGHFLQFPHDNVNSGWWAFNVQEATMLDTLKWYYGDTPSEQDNGLCSVLVAGYGGSFNGGGDTYCSKNGFGWQIQYIPGTNKRRGVCKPMGACP